MIDLLFCWFQTKLKYFRPNPFSNILTLTPISILTPNYPKTSLMIIILVILKLCLSLFGNGFRSNIPVNRGYIPVGLNYNLQVTPVPILNVNNPLIIVCGLKLEDDISISSSFGNTFLNRCGQNLNQT